MSIIDTRSDIRYIDFIFSYKTVLITIILNKNILITEQLLNIKLSTK